MAIIQVWSAPSCQSGAQCVGVLSPRTSAAGTEAIGTPAAFRVVVPKDVADTAGVAEGRCLRVISKARGEQWWYIGQVVDSDGDQGLVQINCGPLQQLLTVRGLVRDGGTFTFTPGRRTVTDLLSTYVFTNLSADGLSWLALGTIDFTDTIDIGTLNRATRAAVIALIERETGHTFRLRPFYISGVLASFLIDIVNDLSGGAAAVPLSTGAQLTQITRTRDATRAATVVVPFGSSGDTMDLTQWVVGSFTPGTPAWIPLVDPVAGNPRAIREDGQCIGCYLQKADGSQLVVLDSRASDGAVQVASSGGMTAGDRVTLVRDTSGNPVIELTSPSGVNGSRGRLVATAQTLIADVRRNYVVNGTLTGVSAGAFTSWTNAKAYARTTAQTWTAFVGSALTAGNTYTSLPYTGATEGTVVLPGEIIRINAGGSTQWVRASTTNDIHVVGVTGAGSITIDSWTAPANYTSANALDVVNAVSSGTLGSLRRPASFPSEAAGTSVAFVRGGSTATSASAWAVYDTAKPYVRAAFGVSVKAESATTSSAERPSCKIFAPTGSVTIASATYGTDFSAGQEAHFTLTCGASLASSRLIRAELTSGDISKLTTFLRWASLWLDDSLSGGDMGPQPDSASNLLWHRAQDVLASQGTGVRYTIRGIDLERLRADNTALGLGQNVRLRSTRLGLDTTVPIVKLDYDFAETETLSAECGLISPRLTGVTVSL